MSQLVPPHGATSINALLLPETQRADDTARAEKLKQVPLGSREMSDVFMLAMGAYTPLDGFMGHDDWRGVCQDMKLADGTFWPIPITLPVDAELASSINLEEEIALVDAETGAVLAIMEVREKYEIDKKLEAELVTLPDSRFPRWSFSCRRHIRRPAPAPGGLRALARFDLRRNHLLTHADCGLVTAQILCQLVLMIIECVRVVDLMLFEFRSA